MVGARGAKLYITGPDAICSGVNETPKSTLKSECSDDHHGNRQPMRCWYCASAAYGPRETATSATSRPDRCGRIPSKWSIQNEQPWHAALAVHEVFGPAVGG